ncbi:hypothetical protein J4E85_005752 [Alternaria conjuncta]|uniref:uncharacterized protein n=1 Tax=Alternaria conjuncta TaxID=181017 RepID=UPI0022210659|nr:uncharacterized protein J4E85_005752 [Alternaria conjuncta]KAI4929127.1 hypothetical protein J4E85_005752 [Alternaria conjuncta]
MSIEVALAIIATADLAIKYGKNLVQMYDSYQNADKEIGERLLKMQVIWHQVQWQVQYLMRVRKALEEEFLAMQDQILGQLVNRLKAAMSEVQKLEKKQGPTETDPKATKDTQYSKWKYPFIKKGLDAAIGELKEWQGYFDPGWYHIMRISDNLVDTGFKKPKSSAEQEPMEGAARKIMSKAKTVRNCLRMDPQGGSTTVFMKAEETSNYSYTAIPYSTAYICHRSSKDPLIADSVPATPGISLDIQSRDVRDLARKLTDTDPISFCLLKCRGVSRVYKTNGSLKAFDFHFHIPSSLHSPQSLRNILIESKPNMSLSVRFRLAQQLARSLSYVHMYEFVHKGIRPETVLIFDSGKTELAHSFLLGFEKFRADAGRTLKTSDSVWERDLYRHPERQGEKPEEAYKMQHDIYSLGVCLLEIGMWRTLVTYSSMEGEPTPSQLLPPPDYSEKDEVGKAKSLKHTLIEIAMRELPSCMGDKYTGIVISCLTCLDTTNPDFSDENDFKDEDDVIVGVRYIQKVSNKTPTQLIQY